MPDELKSNPSHGEASADAKQNVDSDTDQLVDNTAQSGPKTDADTDEMVDKTIKNGTDKPQSKPAHDTSVSQAARAIPSLPLSDDSKTNSVSTVESSSEGDDDTDVDEDDIDTAPPKAMAEDSSLRIPFDPPPTQGKRFKEIHLKPDGTVEVVPLTDKDADTEVVEEKQSPEASSKNKGEQRDDEPKLAANENEKATSSTDTSKGERDEAQPNDNSKNAIPAVWLEDAAEGPDTNPLHPSTRQPRQPHNWQLQRHADNSESNEALENSESKVDADDGKQQNAASADAKPKEPSQAFPALDLDTSELKDSNQSASVTGLKAMPSMPASAEDDKTRPPSANTQDNVLDPDTSKSAFTFSMSEEDLQSDTAVLSKENRTFQRAINKQEPTAGTSTLGEQREVILVIRGMIERLIITEKKPFMLGRFELGRKQDTEIDLTPYGALDRGVSRVHAQLHLQDNHLYITDLGSTNGTYLAGARLDPNEPTLLRKGDELLIGRLSVQVMFR